MLGRRDKTSPDLKDPQPSGFQVQSFSALGSQLEELHLESGLRARVLALPLIRPVAFHRSLRRSLS